jgi:short-chain fatty acids transporter
MKAMAETEVLAGRSEGESSTSDAWYVRTGVRLADWAERWWPDPFVFVLIAVLLIFAITVMAGTPVTKAVNYYGSSFWSLIPFTLQTALVIVAGYVLAVSPPVYKIIVGLAAIPRTSKGAVAFIALFSLLTSLISWGLSLIFSGFLAREIALRVKDLDYRAAGAAGYLGLGATWALGLSSSAALLMNTKSSVPSGLLDVSGIIPLSHTIFAWQSIVVFLIVSGASITVAYLTAPSGHKARTAASLGVRVQPLSAITTGSEGGASARPGEWFEHVPYLPVAISALGLAYLWQLFSERGGFAALDLNTYNFIFLMVGLLFHWRLRSFLSAVAAAVPATAGIIIQYAFYAGIFGLITKSSISDSLAHFFVGVSNQHTLPLLAGIYSAIVGFFIPSGGGKWILEAPFLLKAAVELKVHLGWMVTTYNAAEALPNLINPFWMLPLLGVLGIKARDIIGYSLIQFIVHAPLVLFLIWILAFTFEYVPPLMP